MYNENVAENAVLMQEPMAEHPESSGATRQPVRCDPFDFVEAEVTGDGSSVPLESNSNTILSKLGLFCKRWSREYEACANVFV